jgi:hypothetical protein
MLMLICCERKTLLNDWLILADKFKQTEFLFDLFCTRHSRSSTSSQSTLAASELEVCLTLGRSWSRCFWFVAHDVFGVYNYSRSISCICTSEFWSISSWARRCNSCVPQQVAFPLWGVWLWEIIGWFIFSFLTFRLICEVEWFNISTTMSSHTN